MTVTFMVTKRAHWRALVDVTRRTRSYKLSVAFLVILPAAILVYGMAKAEHMGCCCSGRFWYSWGSLHVLPHGVPAPQGQRHHRET